MRKFLRFSLLLLLAMIGYGNVYADVTDVLTLSNFGVSGTSYKEVTGVTASSNAIYAAQMAGGNKDNESIQLRTKNSNSGIVTTASGGNVKSIKVEWNTNTADARVLDVYGSTTAYSNATQLYSEETQGTKIASFTKSDGTKEITIDGSYQFIGFRSASDALYIDKITIVWDGEASTTVTVKTPEISGTTPFIASTEVTISVPDGGSTYYTIDGSTPSKTNGTAYSAPFTLTETTTVKAISYDEDDNASSVAEMTFTKEEEIVANNIRELLAIESGALVTLKLNDAKVLYAGTNDIIIKDATGGIDFYQTDLSLTAGQVLNGTIIVARYDYNGFKEVKKAYETNLDKVNITNGTATATTTTVDQIANAEDCSDLYKLEKVEVQADGSKFFAVNGDSKIQLYNQFKISGMSFAVGTFNIEGFVGNYKGTKQFWPIKAPEAVGVITVEEASNIADFKSKEQGKVYNLNLKDAQVIYAWTSSNGNIQAFVRDASGAICMDFRNNNTPGESFTINKVVNGSIIMNNALYNGLPQAGSTAESNTEKLTFTDSSAAEPVKITTADAANYVCDLVLLENVTITENNKKFYVDDVQIYNGFHIEEFDDLTTFVGEGKTVKGIMVIYQPKSGDPIYEIYPIEITGASGVNAVIVEKAKNNIRYNLAGQRVDESYKGVVIMNGKKFVVK